MAIYKKQYTKPLPAGAEIIEKDGKNYARWLDRQGRKRTAEAFTTPDGAWRIRKEVSTLTVKYRDANGVVRETSSGCRTRSSAETIQTEIRKRRELVRAGVLTPEEDAISMHASTGISDHTDCYLRHLSLIATPCHVAHVRQHLRRLIAECGFARLADLNADRLERWIAARRSENMGARTINTYISAAHAFSEWCVTSGRLSANPFKKVPKADEKTDRRHQRRALTEDEVRRLFKAARLRPLAEHGRIPEKTDPDPRRRKRSNWRLAPLSHDTIEEAAERARVALSAEPETLRQMELLGWERALIYKTLLQTGLRVGELASIRLGQVCLDSPLPHIELKASDEKSRRGSTIPLRADLAGELRDFVRTRHPWSFLSGKRKTNGGNKDHMTPLFEVPAGLCNILKRDLAAAGIPRIDSRGRFADVHALRHTFGTYLCRAGVPLRTAQAAMRHSDPKLTANVYTDPALLDVAGALDALPALPAANGEDAPGAGSKDQTKRQA